ncbi:hypothetical protein BST97_15615 (plasmid) [Nonlabens spongiae]|uniref:HTH tetR-type domain-containing protein n=1 Tax=Nonlabens spongiae TaxID=331648 RepID=A0A1W6MP58_9FLAO|nr:TetR/AcrR family transcriptional regulator [Nonlabens spongiae]ARN79388.1 hypothetical protein BST97_05520 [Nonlabens spongiae]ARN79534.1 hypothetical protein BST97_15615 [Nonlabens spongiae]
MISKLELLQASVKNFTRYGSKRVTMDELSKTLGISKKTIYHHFQSKEELINASINHLIIHYKKNIDQVLSKNQDPIISIILLYKKGFEELRSLTPSFLYGLGKYYPEAKKIFDDFRRFFVDHLIHGLLEDAKSRNLIHKSVNINLFCDLYFRRIEDLSHTNDSLLLDYSNDELLKHMIIFNMKGILTETHLNSFNLSIDL